MGCTGLGTREESGRGLLYEHRAKRTLLTPPLTCIEPEIPQPVKPSPRRRTQSYRAYGEDDDAGIGSAARVKRIK